MKTGSWIKLIPLFALLLHHSTSYAAYCSLRDPIAAINKLYGLEVRHRSIVSSITNDDRLLVKQRLPFTLHSSEVGKHTLYVIYKNQSPQGFVQARSELAEWGLMEIAWAINLDMTVGDFFYQRCRGSDCGLAAISNLHSLLAGKSFQELKALLSDDGKHLFLEKTRLPEHLAYIALLTIRSALKTIAITEISWSGELGQLRNDNNGS